MQSSCQHAPPAGTRLDNYEIRSVLGIGGSGITCRACDRTVECDVAIKEHPPVGLAVRGGGTSNAPVRRLTLATERLSTGRDADLGLAGIKQGNGNEIHQLAFSFNRLRSSLAIALQPMRAAGGGKEPGRK